MNQIYIILILTEKRKEKKEHLHLFESKREGEREGERERNREGDTQQDGYQTLNYRTVIVQRIF